MVYGRQDPLPLPHTRMAIQVGILPVLLELL